MSIFSYAMADAHNKEKDEWVKKLKEALYYAIDYNDFSELKKINKQLEEQNHILKGDIKKSYKTDAYVTYYYVKKSFYYRKKLYKILSKIIGIISILSILYSFIPLIESLKNFNFYYAPYLFGGMVGLVISVAIVVISDDIDKYQCKTFDSNCIFQMDAMEELKKDKRYILLKTKKIESKTEYYWKKKSND